MHSLWSAMGQGEDFQSQLRSNGKIKNCRYSLRQYSYKNYSLSLRRVILDNHRFDRLLWIVNGLWMNKGMAVVWCLWDACCLICFSSILCRILIYSTHLCSFCKCVIQQHSNRSKGVLSCPAWIQSCLDPMPVVATSRKQRRCHTDLPDHQRSIYI